MARLSVIGSFTGDGLAERPRDPSQGPGVDSTRQGPRGVRVRWAIARRAVAAARPGLLRDVNSAQPVSLVLDLPGDGAGWSLSLEDPMGGRYDLRPELNGSAGAAAQWTIDTEAKIAHADIPGVARVSLVMEGGPASHAGLRVLYAVSPALGRIGIAGGRYEVAGAEPMGAEPGSHTDSC